MIGTNGDARMANANSVTRPSDEALRAKKRDIEPAPLCDNIVPPPKPEEAMPPPNVAHKKETPGWPPTRASLQRAWNGDLQK